MTLKIKRRYNFDDWELIAEHRDGQFEGDEDFLEHFAWLEGEDEETIMNELDGPNLIAVRPEETEKEGMTSGTAGAGQATYGGAGDDEEEDEGDTAEKIFKETDASFEEIDEAFFRMHKNVVQWQPEEGESLEKAPMMWRGGESMPEFVKEYIRKALDAGAFWQGDFASLPADARRKLKDVFERSMTQPQGWSLSSLVENIQEEFPTVDTNDAEEIARNESAAIANKARKEAYEASEDAGEEFEYYWSGPADHRTTPLCEKMKELTNPNYGGTPRPMGELKQLLMREAKNFEGGTPDRIDDLVPHYQCRHTFTREVYL